MINDLAIFALFVVGGYDLYLELTGRRTISEAYQALLPTWADILILLAVLPGIHFLPVYPFFKIVLAALAGHIFFPNKETWRQ